MATTALRRQIRKEGVMVAGTRLHLHELMLFTLFAATAIWTDDARSVPSYARQTGQECIACHVSFPELTPYGRFFKLTGYTIGKAAISGAGVNYIPMAVMAQASITNTRNNH